MEEPYTKRETDIMHQGIENELKGMRRELHGINTRLDFTNGKIKKIITALFFAFGMIIGLGATNFSAVLKILI